MTGLRIVVVGVAVVATALGDLRWLRVAQREHYLAGSVSRFALRWWTLGPNRVLAIVVVLGVIGSPVALLTGLAGVLALAVGPFRYSLLGRSPGRSVWTARLRTVAAATAGIQLLVLTAGVVLGGAVPVACVVALTAPAVIDISLAALAPLEARKAAGFVDKAVARLAEVHPLVLAITGSYGKTTTKAYAAHLIRGSRTVVPSPASFNNRAGLSRAINENLVAGTDVFIAEMGTYGPGEIAELCRWCPPDVAAITAIGPVHLERFGSEDAIVRAKSEILEGAKVAVLNVDDPRLAALADARAEAGQTVIRCSASDPTAGVCARVHDERLVVSAAGRTIADITAPDGAPGNIAVAVALALAAEVPPEAIEAALASLPQVANRRTTTTLSTGATAIDDTFNANPAGARAALSTLERLSAAGHKRVIVTPGMVELGARQFDENVTFSESAARAGTHLILVGATNRRALARGARQPPSDQRADILVADTHERAVEWVKANTGPGDVVLYENQLPDHYP